jgi:hypothetical protein
LRRRVPIALAACCLLLIPWSARAQGPIALVPTDEAGFVGEATQGPVNVAQAIDSLSEFDQIFGSSSGGLTHPDLRPAVAAFFQNGGGRVHVVRLGSDAGAISEAIDALASVDEVSMLAAPGLTDPAVQQALIDQAENLGDRIAILDSSPSPSVATALSERNALASSAGFGVFYAPWYVGTVGGAVTQLPPSGAVAGIWASVTPYSSPVSLVAGASGVTVDYDSADTDQLVPAGIDPLRFFAGQGVRVWGARTIATDTEWKYVAVRRVALLLEESIDEGTSWAVFEANDETLWSQLRDDVGNFLFARFQEGWFQGATTNEAYFVRCGYDTMTAQDIGAGRTVILVGFAPLRPAEFTTFTLVQQHVSTTAALPRSRVLDAVSVAPSPFNPRTTLHYDLGRAASVTVDLFDVAGRRVRRLLDGEPREAGPHAVVWNGQDDRDRPVASGVYRIVVRAAGQSATTRAVLVR